MGTAFRMSRFVAYHSRQIIVIFIIQKDSKFTTKILPRFLVSFFLKLSDSKSCFGLSVVRSTGLRPLDWMDDPWWLPSTGHGAAEVLLDSSSGSWQLSLTASMLFMVGQLTLKDGPNEE